MDAAIDSVVTQGGILGALLVLSILALGYLVRTILKMNGERSADLLEATKTTHEMSTALMKVADGLERNTRMMEAVLFKQTGSN